jgi:methionyl-tRNA formyltransferase
MQMQQSAVKKYALEKGLHILQPEKLKNAGFIEALQSLHADVQVVVAFRMLPEVVWNMPPMGTINVHASLLPDYRGAAPINRAIINGEKVTGVTTFTLQHEIDTGNILLQESIGISDNETAGELHDALQALGAKLIVETLTKMVDGTIEAKPQPQQAISKTAPKIHTDTCRIDWNNSVENIFNLIRGLSPFPTAFTFLDDKVLKIFACKKELQPHDFATGTIHSDGKTFLKFACTNGFIHCTEIQMQGKKKMNVEDFLRGYRLTVS